MCRQRALSWPFPDFPGEFPPAFCLQRASAPLFLTFVYAEVYGSRRDVCAPLPASHGRPRRRCPDTSRPRDASSAEPRFIRRSVPPPLPPPLGLLRGRKMDYSDPPGLLCRRAEPRSGKHSAPHGLAAAAAPRPRTAPHGGGSGARRRALPTALRRHLSLGALITAAILISGVAASAVTATAIPNSPGRAVRGGARSEPRPRAGQRRAGCRANPPAGGPSALAVLPLPGWSPAPYLRGGAAL